MPTSSSDLDNLVIEVLKFHVTILQLEQILQLQLCLPYQSAVQKSLECFTLCSSAKMIVEVKCLEWKIANN